MTITLVSMKFIDTDHLGDCHRLASWLDVYIAHTACFNIMSYISQHGYLPDYTLARVNLAGQPAYI